MCGQRFKSGSIGSNQKRKNPMAIIHTRVNGRRYKPWARTKEPKVRKPDLDRSAPVAKS